MKTATITFTAKYTDDYWKKALAAHMSEEEIQQRLEQVAKEVFDAEFKPPESADALGYSASYDVQIRDS